MGVVGGELKMTITIMTTSPARVVSIPDARSCIFFTLYPAVKPFPPPSLTTPLPASSMFRLRRTQ